MVVTAVHGRWGSFPLRCRGAYVSLSLSRAYGGVKTDRQERAVSGRIKVKLNIEKEFETEVEVEENGKTMKRSFRGYPTAFRKPGAIESDDDLYDALLFVAEHERFGVAAVAAVE